MRYADTLLTEGETVILRTRQHWLALLSRARTALLLWLIGIALLVVVVWFNVQPGLMRDILSVAALIVVLLGVIIFVYRAWQWWAQDYAVTNRRLLKVTGILNKRSADSSLEKINDAILSQSIWGRMLNFGNLEILTAADMAVDRYYMLNAPKEFKKVMLTQKHALETEHMYGRLPSPPLRATVETQARPAEPMRAEPMADAPAPLPPSEAMAPAPETVLPATLVAADEDEESVRVTETLARLADLRDDGAITAEEYEQKKDELLGRL
ncbi:MAG: PH domain-containing protein [Candidatus Limnocylindrales bacterium]